MIPQINNILNSIAGFSALLATPLRPDKVYEIYIFTRVMQVLRNMGAQLEIRDARDRPTQDLVFRLSPGYLWSPTSQAGFVFVSLNGNEYELHNGLRIQGRSGVLHEADVCIIERAEGSLGRSQNIHPRQSKTNLLIECKFYGRDIPLHLGREYLGLKSEFSLRVSTMASNSHSVDVFNLIRSHKGTSNFNLSVSSASQIQMFEKWLQKELEHGL